MPRSTTSHKQKIYLACTRVNVIFTIKPFDLIYNTLISYILQCHPETTCLTPILNINFIHLPSSPSRSPFSRVQRLCCCLCILYLTMIANAMWFRGDDEEQENNQSGLVIGPISLTVRQLYVSVMSSALVVPPVLLVTFLFAKSRQRETRTKVANSYAMQGAMERERQGRKKLPFWCVYVAYAIIAVAVAASAFFTILYAFEWGKEKSEKWLVTFVLCFLESVIFIQPIKVNMIFFMNSFN